MSDTSTSMLPALLTIPEAAEFCRVSRKTMYRRVRSGEVPAVRVGASDRTRAIRIRRDELEAWLYGDHEGDEQ